MNLNTIIDYLDKHIVPSENSASYYQQVNLLSQIHNDKNEPKDKVNIDFDIDLFEAKYRYFIKDNRHIQQMLLNLKAKHDNKTKYNIFAVDDDTITNAKVNDDTISIYIKITPNLPPNDNIYMFNVWNKMLQLCDILDSPNDESAEDVPKDDKLLENDDQKDKLLEEKDQKDNELFIQIIQRKIDIANKERKQRVKKLRARINYVMSSLTYDLLRVRNEVINTLNETFPDNKIRPTFSNVFTDEGINIYDFKDLMDIMECIQKDICKDVNKYIYDQYERVMKGVTSFKLNVMTKKPEKLKLRQKPYIESFSSYRIQKDLDSSTLSIGNLKRNVRISSSDQNMSNSIKMKKGWYILKQVNDILTQVQLFFTYVKEIFANTTINMRNHLDTIYTKEEMMHIAKINRGVYTSYKLVIHEWIEAKGYKQESIQDVENRMKQKMTDLNKTLYAPLSARLYSIANEFLTKLIECKDISQADITKFRSTVESIKADLQKLKTQKSITKTGGGIFGNLSKLVQGKIVNACINTVDIVKHLSTIINVSITQVMRYMTEMNPWMARILMGVMTLATCSTALAFTAAGNIVMGAGLARYCLIAGYLAYFSWKSDEDKIAKIQEKMGSAIGTTGVIIMIMKYGGIRSIHEPLLKSIKDIITTSDIEEKKFVFIKTVLEKKTIEILEDSLNKKLETVDNEQNKQLLNEQFKEEFSEQNMYIFHRKLLDIIIEAKNANADSKRMSDALKYFIKNTPKDPNELREAIELMVGDASLDHALYPIFLTREQKTEFNYKLNSKIANPDLRKYLALCILEVINNENPTLKDVNVQLFMKWMTEDMQEQSEITTSNTPSISSVTTETPQQTSEITDQQFISNVTNDTLYTDKKKKVIENISSIFNKEEPLLSYILEELSLLKKFKQKLPLQMRVLNYMYKNAINKLYKRHTSNELKGLTLYKKVIEDTISFIKALDYKFKYPSYTIFMFSDEEIKEFLPKHHYTNATLQGNNRSVSTIALETTSWIFIALGIS